MAFLHDSPFYLCSVYYRISIHKLDFFCKYGTAHKPDGRIARTICYAQHLVRNMASTKMGRQRVNVFTDTGLCARVAT